MKKEKRFKIKFIICPIVIILIIISIVAFCANKGIIDFDAMTKEEMLEIENELNIDEFKQECSVNIINAKEKYLNKYYKYTRDIVSINENYIVMKDNVKVYLPKDELKQLSNGEYITIVGKIQNVSSDNIEIKKAHLVSDKIDILGVVFIPYIAKVVNGKVVDLSEEYDWYCQINSSKPKDTFYFDNNLIPVENRKFTKAVSNPSIIDGNEISATDIIIIRDAKVINENGKFVIKSYDSFANIDKDTFDAIYSK